MDLTSQSPQHLLQMTALAAMELKRRAIIRTGNAPLGDVAEYLFCQCFGWEIAGNSQSGFDALSADTRYQIKARRISAGNKSRQLSAIRNLEAKKFDYLAVILFGEDYDILRAAIIPHALVKAHSRHTAHTNSARFLFTDTMASLDGVTDVTAKISDFWAHINFVPAP
ncbi:MAG: hypothetical protein HC843_05070 [Sphingomonadales bacterium]|nr:hypothetical protein [Sphingomonadales bacterium]